MTTRQQELTNREKAFVEYYCGEANWNGAKAARLSGYAEHSARITAAKLLTKTNVRQAVEKRRAELSKKTDITVSQIQSELIALARDNAEKRPSAAVSAYVALLKTLGGFMADKLPDENLAGKALDAKKAEDLRKIADLYYSQQYLATPAVKAIESTIESDLSENATNVINSVDTEAERA